MKKLRVLCILFLTAVVAGCAATANAPAYPAFVISDDLPDLFLAHLPGVLAKEYSSDMRSRTASNRIDLPAGWSGTTGGSPGKALEIFVLSGTLNIADVDLIEGGYVYVPPGSLGFNLVSDDGARVLWFLSDIDATAAIKSPLILDSNLVDWQATDNIGVFVKDLRLDPGSGEHTWLLRYEVDAQIPWQSSSESVEGYLMSGQFRQTECVDGLPYSDVHFPGGYFKRPAQAIHGGPEAAAIAESVWFLRAQGAAEVNSNEVCQPAEQE